MRREEKKNGSGEGGPLLRCEVCPTIFTWIVMVGFGGLGLGGGGGLLASPGCILKACKRESIDRFMSHTWQVCEETKDSTRGRMEGRKEGRKRGKKEACVHAAMALGYLLTCEMWTSSSWITVR